MSDLCEILKGIKEKIVKEGKLEGNSSNLIEKSIDEIEAVVCKYPLTCAVYSDNSSEPSIKINYFSNVGHIRYENGILSVSAPFTLIGVKINSIDIQPGGNGKAPKISFYNSHKNQRENIIDFNFIK